MEGRENDLDKDTFEFIGDPKDAVFVERQFLGKTKRDLEIESMPIPKRPWWLRSVIKAIRFYQRKISGNLGNRCVFDPSCSHYSEIAFRKRGLLIGFWLTLKRLYRCRPSNGGIDEII